MLITEISGLNTEPWGTPDGINLRVLEQEQMKVSNKPRNQAF